MNKGNFVGYLLVCFLSIIAEIQQCSANRNNKDSTNLNLKYQKTIQNKSIHEVLQLNSTDGKLIWEGGSFPFDEERPESDQTAFYYKAVLVAPIVGSILMISLVVAGVYALRQYDVPTINRGKDAEAICSNCSKPRVHGLRTKIYNYVNRLFAISKCENEAFFIRIDSKSRTENMSVVRTLDARETLV